LFAFAIYFFNSTCPLLLLSVLAVEEELSLAAVEELLSVPAVEEDEEEELLSVPAVDEL